MSATRAFSHQIQCPRIIPADQFYLISIKQRPIVLDGSLQLGRRRIKIEIEQEVKISFGDDLFVQDLNAPRFWTKAREYPAYGVKVSIVESNHQQRISARNSLHLGKRIAAVRKHHPFRIEGCLN